MTAKHLLVAAAVAALALAGYFWFPGHTYLQSDTQIYLPILERLYDPSVFHNELLAQRPHVSFTLYDEIAVNLRRLTGLDFHSVLAAQQIVLRALGIFGIYLLATALGLSRPMGILVAAIFSLGATIGGPTVLTIEYEPVPRGFAVPLLLLGVGLAAHGRDLAAGIAASCAFLYHPPAGYAFWIVYFLMTLWPTRPAVMSRRIAGLLPLLGAVLLLLFFSRHQTGITEPQVFLTRLDPEIERLQRLRAPYNWITEWVPGWISHYVFLWAVSVGAYLRLRKSVTQDLRFFVLGIPLISVLSMPLSYWLLDRMKFALVSQVQPMRALLFVTVFAGVLAAVAGVQAVQERRRLEGFLWLLVAFAIPVHTRVLELLLPRLSEPEIRRRVLVVVALAALAALAAALERSRRIWALPAFAAAVALPFAAIPLYGEVSPAPNLWTPDLVALARWARTSTPPDSVFLFPGSGRSLEPGIFRAESLRAVYVDWKTGGQVNFLPRLGMEWWSRWQRTGAGKFDPKKPPAFRELGIDFIVLKPANRLTWAKPYYENSQYIVYRTRS